MDAPSIARSPQSSPVATVVETQATL
ncbi:MAG: hypothetical protein ACI8PQ_002251, partial [Planctomycetota bacterium]